jgi:HD-like signal output (HDOD) protein
MNTEEFRRLLVEAKDLPLLPQVVILVQKTIDEEGSSAHDLANAISKDQVLTSRLLKLANSSFYRFTNKSISTVTEAIVLLGFETVKNITLGLSVYKLLSGFNKENSFHFFWRHSLCCAMAAQSLAEEKRMKTKETAFVAGLLHDIGKVILAHYFPVKYKKVLKILRENPGKTFSQVEKQIIGLSHHDAGGLLGEYWNLPLEIEQPMRLHDFAKIPDSEAEVSPYHQVIYVANHIACNLYGTDYEKERYSYSLLSREAKRLLKIDSDDLFKIINRLSEQVFETARMLDITIDDIRLQDTKKKDITEDQVLMLSQNLQRRESQLKLLMRINEAILEIKDVRQILELATDGLSQLCSPRRLIFAFVNTNGVIAAKLGYGDISDELIESISVKTSNEDDLMVRCLNENTFVNTSQFSDNILDHLPDQMLFEKLNTHRLAIFPIQIRDAVRGVMIFEPTQNEAVDELSETFLETFCNSLSIAFSKNDWSG